MDLGGVQGDVALSERHRAILRAIGHGGATEQELGAAARSRELDDLSHGGYVVYWPALGRPRAEVVGGAPGTWCLTVPGLAELGFPALRFA